MRHDLTLKSGRFLLRPVTLDDAGFILRLRTDPVAARFILNTSTTLEQQRQWLERYFERPGDYYFVIQHAGTGEPQGTAAIYDHDQDRRRAEWGRWLTLPGSLCALPSAWMVYECAFARLGLASLYSRTQEANSQVVSFHDNFGAVRVGRVQDDPVYGGAVIEHNVNAAEWATIRERIQTLIDRLSRAE